MIENTFCFQIILSGLTTQAPSNSRVFDQRLFEFANMSHQFKGPLCLSAAVAQAQGGAFGRKLLMPYAYDVHENVDNPHASELPHKMLGAHKDNATRLTVARDAASINQTESGRVYVGSLYLLLKVSLYVEND